MAALITIMTAYICHIPVGTNGGYIHFGDALIYLSATLLPKPYAICAAAIGGGVADLLTTNVDTSNSYHQNPSYTFFHKQNRKNNNQTQYICNHYCLLYFNNRLFYC